MFTVQEVIKQNEKNTKTKTKPKNFKQVDDDPQMIEI